MTGTSIRAAFVSTNSITQGEQVSSVWKPLYEHFKIHIDFAHRTFRWDSEASIKAQVHCVIVGFSTASNPVRKYLYVDGRVSIVDNINAYLLSAPDVFIERRTTPICNVPSIFRGSQPTDDGNLILTEEEKADLIQKEPQAEKYYSQACGDGPKAAKDSLILLTGCLRSGAGILWRSCWHTA